MFILVFILTILILVVIHELGHFFAAKKFNIKVLEFGFGIPPRAWGKKIGETIWSLNWLPFGGFVRLLGEDETDKKALEDKHSFASQVVWKRITVVIAGVFMNLILAWALFYIVLIAQGFKIIYPSLEPIAIVERVEDNFPAQAAGIKEGERIFSVNGLKVKSPQEVRDVISKTKENEEITVVASDFEGNNQQTFKLIPKKDQNGDRRMGVAFSPFPLKSYNTPVERFFSGITYSYDATRLTFVGLGMLFNDLSHQEFHKASQSVAGPVGLISITRDIVSIGRDAALFYLWFVGTMSLTLAIFNVLPIPALDGGRLFFLLIELVTGKKTHPEFERMVHTIGMVCLLALIALVTYSDISKFNLSSLLTPKP